MLSTNHVIPLSSTLFFISVAFVKWHRERVYMLNFGEFYQFIEINERIFFQFPVAFNVSRDVYSIDNEMKSPLYRLLRRRSYAQAPLKWRPNVSLFVRAFRCGGTRGDHDDDDDGGPHRRSIRGIARGVTWPLAVVRPLVRSPRHIVLLFINSRTITKPCLFEFHQERQIKFSTITFFLFFFFSQKRAPGVKLHLFFSLSML